MITSGKSKSQAPCTDPLINQNSPATSNKKPAAIRSGLFLYNKVTTNNPFHPYQVHHGYAELLLLVCRQLHIL